MPIIGSSASQSGRTPGTPTSVSATAGDAQAVVTFTVPAYTGKGTVSYTVTSSPGGLTASGASSPLTVTGLTNSTAYTFTVTASSSSIASAASSASGSVTPVVPIVYALSATYNAGGTYTVPSGKTKIAFFMIGGGAGGASGSDTATNSSGAGGTGGDGGRSVAVKDYPTNAGTSYTITIGLLELKET